MIKKLILKTGASEERAEDIIMWMKTIGVTLAVCTATYAGAASFGLLPSMGSNKPSIYNGGGGAQQSVSVEYGGTSRQSQGGSSSGRSYQTTGAVTQEAYDRATEHNEGVNAEAARENSEIAEINQMLMQAQEQMSEQNRKSNEELNRMKEQFNGLQNSMQQQTPAEQQ